MKTRLFHLATAFLVLGTAGCSSQPASLPAPGSYIAADVKGKEVLKAAEFAVATEAEALQTRLKLVKVVAAEQQVVAGMNYRMSLIVTQDGKEKTASATVWWQSWRAPDPYRLSSWTWK